MARTEDVAMRIAVALLLAGSAAAQNNNNNNNAATTTTAANNQQTTTANNNQQTTTATNNNNNQQTTTQNQPAAASSNAKGTTTQATVANGPSISITGVPTDSTTTSTSGGSGISSFGLSDLPTIAGYGIPTQIVPWTAGAPFMQQSNLPEGTVFIVVGAFLAFLGVAILAWRGIVAWSIHRSVKRANEKLLYQPESVKLVKPGLGGAASLAQHSNMSLDHLSSTPNNTLNKKNAHAPVRSNIASITGGTRNSSLFFSPTAGAGHPNSSSPYLGTNRSSSFLPSGYYAAPGAAAPASGGQSTHIGTGSANRYSRHSRYHDISPPASPGMPPSSRGLESRGLESRGLESRGLESRGLESRGHESRGGSHGMYHQPSTSSLNLNVPGNAHSGGRAPSANLDDMLGDYPLPNAR
jgi:hypothetical protein